MDETVMTVLGPVPIGALGFTLPHEHLSCDPGHLGLRELQYAYAPTFEILCDEVAAFKRTGGNCIVDLTPRGLGRDPAWLQRLARATGIQIVMATGWYRESFFPSDVREGRRSVDQLADELIGEITDGVEDTGIRPGIIGEVGVDGVSISRLEEGVHRAAARAARLTGLAIVTHSLRSRVALAQLRVFGEEGLQPSRVIIGHADSVPEISYHLELLDMGASLSFDLFGLPGTSRPQEDQVIALLADLVARGYADRLLLSHDVCADAQLRANGGGGFTYIADVVLPQLRAEGLDDAVAQMTIVNPALVLTTVAVPPRSLEGRPVRAGSATRASPVDGGG
jgi:phosphotriesterase-related protein